MSIEEQLKHFIVVKYGSIRKFAPCTGLPYSTIISILRRGIDNCNGQNLKMICEALHISQEALLNGKIEEIQPIVLEIDEKHHDLRLYLNHFINEVLKASGADADQKFVLDGKVVDRKDAAYIKSHVEFMLDFLGKQQQDNEEN